MSGHVQFKLRLDVRVRKTETKPITQRVLKSFYNIPKPVTMVRSMRQSMYTYGTLAQSERECGLMNTCIVLHGMTRVDIEGFCSGQPFAVARHGQLAHTVSPIFRLRYLFKLIPRLTVLFFRNKNPELCWIRSIDTGIGNQD